MHLLVFSKIMISRILLSAGEPDFLAYTYGQAWEEKKTLFSDTLGELGFYPIDVFKHCYFRTYLVLL